MKYKHRKSNLIVTYNNDTKDYWCDHQQYFIPKYVVEDSADWIKLCTDMEEIKKLQNIPCLSINDVARVYVTANRLREHKNNNEYDLERQGREILEIVKEKLNK